MFPPEIPPKINYITKRIKVGNYNLAYWDEGNKNNEVICFIHGYTGDKLDWFFQIEEFKNRYRCIAHEHRCHGESDVKDETVTIKELSDDFYLFLNKMNINKINLCGHSMGGFVSLQFALDHQDMLNKLILVDTTAKLEFTEYAFDMIKKIGYYEFAKLTAKYTEFPLRKRPSELKDYYKKLSKWEMDRKKNIPDFVAINFMKSFKGQDVVTRLKEIKTKTLIVFGKQDLLIDARIHAKLLHSNIPNSILKLIEGSGHNPTREKIPEFNRILGDFLINKF
ncbi:MAG: alpha/beta hydrolase [Candidatus Lokiarchaeota archaeon]|nr:alpha/beta hydrolase [Candidatus Lokiarchaeota archaeon]